MLSQFFINTTRRNHLRDAVSGLIILLVLMVSLPASLNAKPEVRGALPVGLTNVVPTEVSISPLQNEALHSAVFIGYYISRWGESHDMLAGEKPVVVAVDDLGVFIYGTKTRCDELLEKLSITYSDLPGRQVSCINGNASSDKKSLNFIQLPHLKSVLSSRGLNYWFWTSESKDLEHLGTINNYIRAAGFTRVLVIRLETIDNYWLNRLSKTISHEGVHLFGQTHVFSPICFDFLRTADDCRVTLIRYSNQDDGNRGRPAVRNEICLSRNLLVCIYRGLCLEDKASINRRLSNIILPMDDRRKPVGNFLVKLVEAINERTLGRSKVAESYWLLVEGVPTFLDLKIDKASGDIDGVLDTYQSLCAGSELRSNPFTNIHHLRLGAALLEGFTFCLRGAELVERHTQFKPNAFWTRDGLAWFDVLLQLSVQTNCGHHE